MITRIYKDSYNCVRFTNPNLSKVKNWFPVVHVERDFIGFVYTWTTAVQVEHSNLIPDVNY